ncbi:MAG TPA: excinuclease ABC subunit UvrA, partial [Bacteroidetes bacterium]|nr:excinuclease ABC subunit UvrA [Bacteroidota bacterium]
LTVKEALAFFADQPKILPYLETLVGVGLGYLHLGQASSTLSGGEAQRIKLASELRQADTGNTLYLLDEPTVGLHAADVEVLIHALRQLSKRGNTVICIEHDVDLIRQADWVVDLGPGSGRAGGQLLGQGSPASIAQNEISPTGAALRGEISAEIHSSDSKTHSHIHLKGVATHFLKNINVSIPRNQLTVITGVSGSGKSSLAFDTLFAEARSRFSESLSTYVRSQLKQSNPAQMLSSLGLGPAIAIGRKHISHASRSTVGTVSGLYDHFRLLYSRMAQVQGLAFTARHFSFNHQSGACPTCDGLGYQWVCDPEKLVVNPEKSVLEGFASQNKRSKFYLNPHGQYMAILKTAAAANHLAIDRPWKELDAETKDLILYGTGEKLWKVTWEFKNKTRSGVQELETKWEGFCNYISEEYQRRHTNKNIEDLQALLSAEACVACAGARLKPELLEVRVRGKNIAELVADSIEDVWAWFSGEWADDGTEVEAGIWNEIRAGVLDLLSVLDELGLGYLALSRGAGTLSGGEGQRLRLSAALAANLFGVIYVLDEPTIGLHAQDTLPLLGILRRLVQRGNTVVVVEHDEMLIRAADHLIELGPGAGKNGGEVVVSGDFGALLAHPVSPTGAFLREPKLPTAQARRLVQAAFGLRGVNLHNLQNLDVDFIAGGIIAVTGVSGSGKSTLVREVLLRSIRAQQAVGCVEVYGLEQFEKVLAVDQSTLSGNLLSTPATFTGLLDVLRNLFSRTDDAKRLGLKKSSFSYVHKDGKCTECGGMGQQKAALDFLGDVWLPCEACEGGRYRAESLSCRWQGKTIAAALQLSVAEALEWALGQEKLLSILRPLEAVGLGHILLGQSTVTLSGGEAQRLRLAAELLRQGKGKHLFLFDEPATGLHFQDILRLVALFNQLADAGHTVLFIEHHPMLISIANQEVNLKR